MDNPKFSVVLIARNEEKTLPRLINSLKEFKERGGVVLLLDTGSKDNTAHIARELGCEVHEVGDKFVTVIDESLCNEINNHFVVDGETPIVKVGDRLFDYASARNYISEFAPTDVIATPDCDEIYTKFDIDAINKAIDDGAEQLEYNFVFSHDQFGNELVKFMHCKFYNRKKLHWENIVHEILVGDAKRVYLDESIIKLEHFQNVETNRSGYLRGLALDCFKNQNNDRNSHYLGREMLWTGRPRSAIKELERHISFNRWPQERGQSMIYISRAYGMLNQPEKQVEWLNKAIFVDGSRREPFLDLAFFYLHNKKFHLAICYAKAAIELDWNGFYGNDMSHYTVTPHEILYKAYGWMGKIEEARYHLNKCLEYIPLNTEYLRDYRFYNELPKVSIIIPQLGREDGLKRCIESIKQLNYPQDLIETIVIEGPETVPVKVKKGLEQSTGKFIAYMANDTIALSNMLILAVLRSIKDKKGLVSFNEGPLLPDNGNLCTHFIIDRDLIDRIGGELFDPSFDYVGVDNLLWDKASKLDQAVWCEEAKIIHNHFSKTGIMDSIYEKGWSEVDKDRELLKKKLI